MIENNNLHVQVSQKTRKKKTLSQRFCFDADVNLIFKRCREFLNNRELNHDNADLTRILSSNRHSFDFQIFSAQYR